MAEHLGFHKGRPLAAVVIFRSCLQWKTFQADRTVLFDKIINTMGGQIEKQQDNNGCLSYWLSNTVTLLYLLQKNIKPASSGSYNARTRSPSARFASFLYFSQPWRSDFLGLFCGLSSACVSSVIEILCIAGVQKQASVHHAQSRKCH